MKRLLFMLLLATSVVQAQGAVTGTLNATWTAVTTNTNGSAVTGTITYNVLDCQEATAGTACTPAATTINALTTTSATITGLPTGITECIAVIADETIGGTVFPSASSNVVCVAIPAAATPNAPTITITVTLS